MTDLALLIASGVVALLLTEIMRAHQRMPLFGNRDQSPRQREARKFSDRSSDFIHNGGIDYDAG